MRCGLPRTSLWTAKSSDNADYLVFERCARWKAAAMAAATIPTRIM
jgi:hypothetical protein